MSHSRQTLQRETKNKFEDSCENRKIELDVGKKDEKLSKIV